MICSYFVNLKNKTNMLLNYILIAWRNIVRNRLYSTLNILGLSLSLCAAIIIFLHVIKEISADSHHEKADNIYRAEVELTIDGKPLHAAVTSIPFGEALKNDFPEILDFVRVNYPSMYYGDFLIQYRDRAFYEDGVLLVDTNFFDFFNYEFIYGNPGIALTEPNSIILTTETAEKYFGNINPVGEIISVENQYSLKVTGVIDEPQEYSHLRFHFLIPFYGMDRFVHQVFGESPGFTSNNIYTYLMVEDQFDKEAFRQNHIPGFVKRHVFGGTMPDEERGSYSYIFTPLQEIYFDNRIQAEIPNPSSIPHKGNKTYITVFIAIGIFLILIASINYMNMAISRSLKRSKEVGMRKVLGARRADIASQFIGEALLFVFIALLIASLFVEIALPYFNHLMNKSLSFNIIDNPMIIVILITVTIITGVVSGSYPALYQSRIQPTDVLKDKLKLKGKKVNLKNILLTVQFVISIFIITITLMVYQQVNYMYNKSLGFEPEYRVTVSIPQSKRYEGEWNQRFKNRLEQYSGITQTAFSRSIPAASSIFETWGLSVETDHGFEENLMRILMIEPEFIDLFEMKIVEGRGFDPDLATDYDNSIIINESAAREYGWDAPIGKTIKRQLFDTVISRKVIGVVSDFNYQSLYQPVEPMAIFPVRTDRLITAKIQPGHASEAINHIGKVFTSELPGHPFEYFFIDEVIAASYDEETNTANLLGIFALLSIIISLVGLFGLSGFNAEQRTKEIGIRKTHGAVTMDIIRLLFKDFALFVFVSIIIALPLAYIYMERWLSDFAFRISITPWPFLIAATAAVSISYITIAYHAVKSSGANPVDALKAE